MQEAAWGPARAAVSIAEACDILDRHATAIYTACSFPGPSPRNAPARIVYTLRYLEDRLSAMIEIWGVRAALKQIPARCRDRRDGPPAGETDDIVDDLCQSDIDPLHQRWRCRP